MKLSKLDKVLLKIASQDSYIRNALKEELARFEKGKPVPLSDLPEELQENVENPPPSVVELKKEMQRQARKKRASQALDILKQVLDWNKIRTLYREDPDFYEENIDPILTRLEYILDSSNFATAVYMFENAISRGVRPGVAETLYKVQNLLR